MEIVADASVFLAVILNESDRDWVIHKTSGTGIVSPEVLPYEIGNALIAMKRASPWPGNSSGIRSIAENKGSEVNYENLYLFTGPLETGRHS